MWYECCSNFVKGVYLDLANEYGVKLSDKCLERMDKVLSNLSPLGFSILDDKTGFLLSIVLSLRFSRVSYLKFEIKSDEYIDIGEVNV